MDALAAGDGSCDVALGVDVTNERLADGFAFRLGHVHAGGRELPWAPGPSLWRGGWTAEWGGRAWRRSTAGCTSLTALCGAANVLQLSHHAGRLPRAGTGRQGVH